MKKVFCLLFLFLIFSTPVLATPDSPVIMNTKTHVYHTPECKFAARCLKNCIQTTKENAISKGAHPCKFCGD